MPMEETNMLNLATLRPHHALCALFFEGKGYSQAFVENMTAFVADPQQILQITTGCDVLCQACPHNVNDQCEDEAKVSLFDQRIVNLAGVLFQDSHPTSLNALCQNAYEEILQQGHLAEVCGECEWARLCQEKWQHGDINRRLLQLDAKDGQPA